MQTPSVPSVSVGRKLRPCSIGIFMARAYPSLIRLTKTDEPLGTTCPDKANVLLRNKLKLENGTDVCEAAAWIPGVAESLSSTRSIVTFATGPLIEGVSLISTTDVTSFGSKPRGAVSRARNVRRKSPAVASNTQVNAI